ncbi:exonuclease 1-like [Dendronephthya gigantea]|uniref:exonuclease 1-like n=1 Tax=Dendronephthya gigantea TaxID=151771 RepID=UPI001069E674|nr:exonuclease 1-like [Dendronephthya gigantea]XP_028416689.1 exonuclease 1-like [Dendronephthya gigantea]
MGINGLLAFVKKFRKECNLKAFAGQTAAIDASWWIHKALCVSIKQTGNRIRFGDIFEAHLRIVKESGVVPFVVFDGFDLPGKAIEHERRQREREQILKQAEGQNITKDEANRIYSRAASITFEDIMVCVNICLAECVRYIVSPYESDAQIAHMVLVKLKMSGDGECFTLSEILNGLNLNHKKFKQMCIAAGCDYVKNLKGVGIHTAYRLIQQPNEDLCELLLKKAGTQEYKDHFIGAEAIFRHQTLFNLDILSTTHLHECETALSAVVQHLCGDLLDDLYAKEMVVGNVNTKNREKVNNYPVMERSIVIQSNKKVPALVSSALPDCGDDSNCQEFICDIIHIKKLSSVLWKIPQFPVVTLEFSFVQFKKDGRICMGVIEKYKVADTQPGTFMCTSHCEIAISGSIYTVLWRLVSTSLVSSVCEDSDGFMGSTNEPVHD